MVYNDTNVLVFAKSSKIYIYVVITYKPSPLHVDTPQRIHLQGDTLGDAACRAGGAVSVNAGTLAYAIPLRTECGSRPGGPRRSRSVGVAQVRAHPLLDLLDGHALALGVVGDLVLAQLARLQIRARVRVRVRGRGRVRGFGFGFGFGLEG